MAQMPLQAAELVPKQSMSLQQWPAPMHPPLQGVNPAAHVEHRPAPEQVKPAAHATGLGVMQAPAAQVLTPILLVPMQVAGMHVPVG
jgi:hypothetical protein